MHPRPWRRRPGAALGLLAALAFTVPATSTGSAAADTAQADTADAVSPLRLWAPGRVVARAYDGTAYTDLGLRLIAQGAPFELRSTRASYDEPIRTVWRGPSGDVALPDGAMSTFFGLDDFLTLTVDPSAAGPTRTLHRKGCVNAWSEQVSPDAPATSPYPRSCWYNPYTLGSVQGVQQGWAAPLLSQTRPFRLAPGTYTVTASIAPEYASTFGIAAADASRTITLVVQDGDGDSAGRKAPRGATAEPAAHRPAGAEGGAVAGPVPDLRALPAWAIRVARNGNYLQFSATVWNGGDSPLVVDGFRREGQDVMDAYQYFFDGAGNQTGYQQVGRLHWDARQTHQHWHFEDFARYVLLRADRTEAVRSRKEAFCLANTDAVDQTGPNAVWNPENQDLTTSCGEYGSLSIREVLAAGWGDTYAQFRAGQSFDLKGLPNGTYYVAVVANPDGRLVEASSENNVSLRKVVIGGTPGHRTVRVPQVGVIVEPDTGGH